MKENWDSETLDEDEIELSYVCVRGFEGDVPGEKRGRGQEVNKSGRLSDLDSLLSLSRVQSKPPLSLS